MVTQAQINQASSIVTQLFDKLEALRQTVQAAVNASVAGVPLDQTVINALLAQYTTQKADLATTFQQLP